MFLLVGYRTNKALRKLGNSGPQVAESLIEAGINGIRRSARSCPIAKYIQELDGLEDVRVDEYRITGRSKLTGMKKTLTPPPAISQFIHGFDRGIYSLRGSK